MCLCVSRTIYLQFFSSPTVIIILFLLNLSKIFSIKNILVLIILLVVLAILVLVLPIVKRFHRMLFNMYLYIF